LSGVHSDWRPSLWLYDKAPRADFEAFVPRNAFLESFAETAEDLEIHRRCVAEKAKERLGQTIPIRIYDGDLKQLYFSPFLQQLRAERDKANGVPVHQLSSRYPGGESAWRHEVDPCLRNRIQVSINHKASYEARWTDMLENERRALELEVPRHATGLGRAHAFDMAGRYMFFTAAMERDALSLGFKYDKGRSRRNYPVFSKSISNHWDLCWALEEPGPFFHSPFEGLIVPFLELRSRELRGSLTKAESGEFLHIRYAGIVPGFFNGYWKFVDLAQLETIIKAHLYLYGLIAPIIEGGICKVLENDS
jgi:hypothetical protein